MWLAMRYARPYTLGCGDAVAYMDIADLLRAHKWGGGGERVLAPAVSGAVAGWRRWWRILCGRMSWAFITASICCIFLRRLQRCSGL